MRDPLDGRVCQLDRLIQPGDPVDVLAGQPSLTDANAHRFLPGAWRAFPSPTARGPSQDSPGSMEGQTGWWQGEGGRHDNRSRSAPGSGCGSPAHPASPRGRIRARAETGDRLKGTALAPPRSSPEGRTGEATNPPARAISRDHPHPFRETGSACRSCRGTHAGTRS